jgi:ABC-type dipeptide/oligopeptide/nickel transport system permease subunit
MEDEPVIGRAASGDALIGLHRPRRSPALATTLRVLKAPMAAPCVAIILFFVTCALFAPLLAPYSPREQRSSEALQSPNRAHLLGTDNLGRDELSRMMYGARVSLGISFGAVALGLAVGVVLGLVAGYMRGIADEVIMRLMEVIIAFPGLIFALALVSTVGPSVRNLLIAIGISGIPGLARLVRSQVLTERERDYVMAARTLGATDVRILFRHIWPNCTAPVIVAATLGMGFAVLAEAGLSFLGVGVRPPTPTWGSMLQFAFGFLTIAPYLSIVPGVAIFLLVLSFNLLGDALRDALDPSLRGAGR